MRMRFVIQRLSGAIAFPGAGIRRGDPAAQADERAFPAPTAEALPFYRPEAEA